MHCSDNTLYSITETIHMNSNTCHLQNAVNHSKHEMQSVPLKTRPDDVRKRKLASAHLLRRHTECKMANYADNCEIGKFTTTCIGNHRRGCVDEHKIQAHNHAQTKMNVPRVHCSDLQQCKVQSKTQAGGNERIHACTPSGCREPAHYISTSQVLECKRK